MDRASHKLSSAEESALRLTFEDLRGAEEQQALREVHDAGLEATLDEYRQLRALFAELPQDDPPQALSTRLMVHAAEAAAQRDSSVVAWLKSFALWWAHPAVLGVAGLLIVAGGGLAYFSAQGVAPQEPALATSVQSPPSVQAPAAVTEPSPDPAIDPAEASGELGRLANGYEGAEDSEKEASPKKVQQAPRRPKSVADVPGDGRGVSREEDRAQQETQKAGPSKELKKLVARARRAAKAGRCGELLKLASRIRKTDPAYYSGTFAQERLADKCRPRSINSALK